MVGTALTLGGFTELSGADVYPVLGDTEADDLVNHFPDLLTPHAAGYFQIAQEAQDRGETWSVAKNAADKAYENA